MTQKTCKNWWSKEELTALARDWYSVEFSKDRYNRSDFLEFKCKETGRTFQFTVRRFVMREGDVIPPWKQDEHRLKIFREKYGVRAFSELPEVRAKMAQTYAERHGGVGTASHAVRQKFNESMLEKYGSEWSMNDPQSIAKYQATSEERYGKDFRKLNGQKSKETKLERYGTGGAPNVTWESKPEVELKELFADLNPKKVHIEGREFDICFEDQKILVEFNGLYWHSETKVGKKLHLEKTEIAERNGYHLIHVFSHVWNYRREQVVDFLRSHLGLNQRLYARKTAARQIDKRLAQVFCDENHIQEGVSTAILAFGLFHEEQLVSVMCFSKHHRNTGELVLSRFCSRRGLNIIGGFSKLQTFAFSELKKMGHTRAISWADRSISQGNVYVKNGWKHEETLQPDYFYFKGDTVIAKQSRMKSKVKTPPGMTEREHALLDGLDRVWDCGKIRFSFEF